MEDNVLARRLRALFGLALVVIALLLFMIFRPWAVVGPGYRGVLVHLGAVQPVVLGEGFHFRAPIIQRVEVVDVRVQKAETDAAAASRDLQTVTSRIALNFHVDPAMANVVFQSIGRDYKDRVIDPAIQETVKAITARYTAEELITKRQAVGQLRPVCAQLRSGTGSCLRLRAGRFRFSTLRSRMWGLARG